MTREEIINNIRKEGLNIGKNDVLIGILPTQIQSIVLAYHRYENYVPDFLITSLLSAAATAIGNSFRLRKDFGQQIQLFTLFCSENQGWVRLLLLKLHIIQLERLTR